MYEIDLRRSRAEVYRVLKRGISSARNADIAPPRRMRRRTPRSMTQARADKLSLTLDSERTVAGTGCDYDRARTYSLPDTVTILSCTPVPVGDADRGDRTEADRHAERAYLG